MNRMITLTLLLIMSGTLHAEERFLDTMGKVTPGPVAKTEYVEVPFIVWGGDMYTFHANGGLQTTPDSIYGQMGLKIKLVPGDDSFEQARRYLSGKTLDEVAIDRIREFEPEGGYWLAFSGGKDSIVILDLARFAAAREGDGDTGIAQHPVHGQLRQSPAIARGHLLQPFDDSQVLLEVAVLKERLPKSEAALAPVPSTFS